MSRETSKPSSNILHFKQLGDAVEKLKRIEREKMEEHQAANEREQAHLQIIKQVWTS